MVLAAASRSLIALRISTAFGSSCGRSGSIAVGRGGGWGGAWAGCASDRACCAPTGPTPRAPTRTAAASRARRPGCLGAVPDGPTLPGVTLIISASTPPRPGGKRTRSALRQRAGPGRRPDPLPWRPSWRAPSPARAHRRRLGLLLGRDRAQERVEAGRRQLRDVRLHARLDPPLARRDPAAEPLDVPGAGVGDDPRLLGHRRRRDQRQRDAERQTDSLRHCPLSHLNGGFAKPRATRAGARALKSAAAAAGR